jgi:hypothetical protein
MRKSHGRHRNVLALDGIVARNYDNNPAEAHNDDKGTDDENFTRKKKIGRKKASKGYSAEKRPERAEKRVKEGGRRKNRKKISIHSFTQ